jgi:hypothetical protein
MTPVTVGTPASIATPSTTSGGSSGSSNFRQSLFHSVEFFTAMAEDDGCAVLVPAHVTADQRPILAPLVDIIEQCLRKDPARRPSAAELLTSPLFSQYSEFELPCDVLHPPTFVPPSPGASIGGPASGSSGVSVRVGSAGAGGRFGAMLRGGGRFGAVASRGIGRGGNAVAAAFAASNTVAAAASQEEFDAGALSMMSIVT